MEKITFSTVNFINQTIQINGNQAVIVGNNSSGKTSILNCLEQGLKGKLSNFYVDDKPVAINEYQIIYIKEFVNLKELIKMAKTSPLRNIIIQNVNNEIINNSKYKETINDLESIHNKLESLIKESYFDNLKNDEFNQLILNPVLEKFTINNLVDKLLKVQLYDNLFEEIGDEENCSHFFLRLLVFNILKSLLVSKDKLRNQIILFDLPELYGNLKMLFQINKYLKKLSNEGVTIILVTNSCEYLKLLKPELSSINLVKNNLVYFIKNYASLVLDAILMFSFYESDKLDFSVYKYELSSLITDEDITNEIQYVENSLFKNIIDVIFSDKFNLLLNDDIESSDSNEFIINFKGSIKDLVFIYNISYQSFNIKCCWPAKINDENLLKIINLVLS